MTLDDAVADIETLTETIRERLDSIDMGLTWIEEDTTSHDTLRGVQDDVAEIRRAVAWIRVTMQQADDTPQAAE